MGFDRFERTDRDHCPIFALVLAGLRVIMLLPRFHSLRDKERYRRRDGPLQVPAVAASTKIDFQTVNAGAKLHHSPE